MEDQSMSRPQDLEDTRRRMNKICYAIIRMQK